mmetsp:Transcript_27964/g.90265  ORF Transcript_27964/g.90265 Transcript_27964/m.90265 type:complete len:346 (-) Transcript_27964:974-2011(-)
MAASLLMPASLGSTMPRPSDTGAFSFCCSGAAFRPVTSAMTRSSQTVPGGSASPKLGNCSTPAALALMTAYPVAVHSVATVPSTAVPAMPLTGCPMESTSRAVTGGEMGENALCSAAMICGQLVISTRIGEPPATGDHAAKLVRCACARPAPGSPAKMLERPPPPPPPPPPPGRLRSTPERKSVPPEPAAVLAMAAMSVTDTVLVPMSAIAPPQPSVRLGGRVVGSAACTPSMMAPPTAAPWSRRDGGASAPPRIKGAHSAQGGRAAAAAVVSRAPACTLPRTPTIGSDGVSAGKHGMEMLVDPATLHANTTASTETSGAFSEPRATFRNTPPPSASAWLPSTSD